MKTTTSEMRLAPTGAIYVWHSEDLSYPTQLAAALNRTDLVIRPRSWFTPENTRHIMNTIVHDPNTVAPR